MSPIFHFLFSFAFSNFFGFSFWVVVSSVLLDADAAIELLVKGRVSVNHRLIFHSLLGASVFTIILSLAGAPLVPVVLGVVLHLVPDLFCAGGVPLFWPLSSKFIRLAKIGPVVSFPKSIYSDGNWKLTLAVVLLFMFSLLTKI